MTNFEKYMAEQMKDSEFKREFEALQPQYEVIKQIIRARTAQHITQKELAERTGLKQSNISRLESGNYNPSIEFLQKVAKRLGKELHIEFRDTNSPPPSPPQ